MLALAAPDGREVTAEGRIEGFMLDAPRGQGGFGYDPLFLPEADNVAGRSFAEYAPHGEERRLAPRPRRGAPARGAHPAGPPRPLAPPPEVAVNAKKLAAPYRVRAPRTFRLAHVDPADTDGVKGKDAAEKLLAAGRERLRELQEMLYAQDRWSLLLIFQAMDAAGKDGTIEHVMSGVNPHGLPGLLVQGALGRGTRPRLPVALLDAACPSAGASASSIARTTRRCWSCACTPRSSRRSSCRPTLRDASASGASGSRTSPPSSATWRATATVIRKFFLHVSKEEQKRRFLARIDEPEKNWKFSPGDVAERAHWDDYQRAYEDAIRADQRRRTRRGTSCRPTTSGSRALVVAEAIVEALEELDLHFPKVDAAQRRELEGDARGPGDGRRLRRLSPRKHERRQA